MNKQKKYKFNVIDVLIILVIIAIGVVMYYYTTARNTVISNSEVEVEYVVELKTVHRDYIDKIVKDNSVVETVRDQQIGKVVDVVVSPSYNSATNNETGEMFISYYPPINASEVAEGDEAELEYEYYNVKVKIRGTFKKSETGYNINGFDLVVGEVVHFRVPRFVSEGYCISINEISEEV